MTRTTRRIIIIVIVFAALYAILRYHIFKGVEWSHFPLFIMNKILFFSGFILLVASLALEPVYLIMHNTFSKPEEGNSFQKMVMSPAFGITALTLSALHLAIMGFEGWLTPRKWNGGMPSITLVSVSVFVIGLIVFLVGQEKSI